ncbi:MAG: 6-phosphogluconolactonase, cycloisomerase 2 family [Rhizobacter sp.]|nr:6-phosphogluconolactonase, cycloisomerase 2 family [Rhizobacter sp.]
MNQTTTPSQHPVRATAGWLGVLSVCAIVAACGGGDDDAQPLANQLYTQTNETSNAIVHFTRQANGTLLRAESTLTGGRGTNAVGKDGSTAPDSLAGQHSVIVDAASRLVYAVNGGDNSISVLSIDPSSGALTLKKRTATASGRIPNSLALNKGVLYATFLDGAQQLAAYRVQDDGVLTALAAYDLTGLGALSAAASPTQVVVSPNGGFVVVNAGTGSNAVMALPIKADGTLGAPVTNTAQLATPFAGAFVTPTGAAPAYLTTSITGMSLASYSFSAAGVLARMNEAVTAGVAAPCWLVITPDATLAYVGNGSGALSAFKVGPNAAVTLIDSKAAQEAPAITGVGSVAADSWISPDGKFLYTAYLGDDKIVAYTIGAGGTLTKLGENIVGTATHLSLQGLAGI